MISKLNETLRFQQEALNLRAHRQQVLASNIANADTPHYKARDFDFATALNDAVAGRQQGGLDLATTSSRHLPGGQSAGPVRLMYRADHQSSIDGNTVDMDVERAAFAENAIQYEAMVQFINMRLRGLSNAIAPAQ